MPDNASVNPPATTKKGSRKRLPTLDSYQGRYLSFATLLILVLVTIAWIGHAYVSEVTGAQVRRLETRTSVERTLQVAVRQLQEIEEWLHDQLVEPGIRQNVSLDRKIDELRSAFTALDKLVSGGETEAIPRRLLDRNLPDFRKQAAQFRRIAHDNRLRFPSTQLMMDRMLERGLTFTSTINDVISELLQGPPESIDLQLLTRSYDLRETWQNMLLEVRLLVANRFGVFSDDPLAGVKARADNIETHYTRLRQQLNRLQAMPLPPGGLFLEPETWQTLERIAGSWHQAYHQLLASLLSEQWRQDLHFHKTILEPRLNAMRSELRSLQGTLGAESTLDIKGLARVAEQLTQAILLIALAGVLIIVAGYYYLRTRIIRPIAETTRALRLEASGVVDNQIPVPKLRETRDLVNAFAELRREVSRRQRGLDYLAHHDPLTRLPNRVLFKDRLQHAIQLAQRNNQMVALLFLDLDNFKQINDTLGHLAGDELLVNVGKRLKNLLRSTDTVARLGGDEFAILLENIDGKRQARNAASKILSALSEPMTVNGHEFHLTASIGIAMAPFDDSVPDNLIRDADSAMYEAKRQGKNAYFFFSSELLERATSQLNLEREIRVALENQEFLLHYQPIIHTRSKKIYGVEALIRWQPKEGDLRYPDQFLETLLRIDSRQEYLERLLEQVDALQERCSEELQLQLPVAINLSATVLRNSTHHKLVLNALKRRKFPELLRIEITEDTLLEDLTNAHVLLNEIRRLGIPLVLDDFGTGQSSLNHLRSFPFDAIKVDREFVMNIDKNADDATLVKAITQLAHSFNMKVVAEGVETQAHLRYLTEIGCDYLQGYLISKPVSADSLFAMLEQIRSRLKAVN